MSKTLEILVVESDPPAAMELQQGLAEMGHMVSYTTAGESALDQAARRKPDLVILDVVLKGSLDGIQTAQKFRDQFNCPAIFFTANTESDLLDRAIAINPLGFLAKPFQSSQLRLVLGLADRRRADTAAREERNGLLTGIVDSLLDGVLALSKDESIQFLNSRGERMTGRGADDLFGKPVSTIFPDTGENTQLLANVRSAFQETPPAVGGGGRGIVLSADGSQQAVVVLISPVKDRSGGPPKFVTMMFRPAPKATDTPAEHPYPATADDEAATEPRTDSSDTIEAALSNGNPMREKVLRAISKRLESNTQSFATVLILNQFDAFRGRYGITSAEKLVHVFAANLMKLLPEQDRMYQWSSRTIIVLSDRNSSLDDMRLEMTALCARRIDYFLHASERSALLTLSASWTLLPVMETGSLEAIAEQIEAFEKLHTRSRRTLLK